MTRDRLRALTTFASGLLFALGLGVSGMVRPEKVQGFLDVAGRWDPSLAWVMGGAVVTSFVSLRLMRRRGRPWFAGAFGWPTRRDITPQLVTGATLFGVGWGLSGMCPGPAIVDLVTLQPGVWLFSGAMLLGMGLYRVQSRPRAPQPARC